MAVKRKDVLSLSRASAGTIPRSARRLRTASAGAGNSTSCIGGPGGMGRESYEILTARGAGFEAHFVLANPRILLDKCSRQMVKLIVQEDCPGVVLRGLP